MTDSQTDDSKWRRVLHKGIAEYRLNEPPADRIDIRLHPEDQPALACFDGCKVTHSMAVPKGQAFLFNMDRLPPGRRVVVL
jgi:hypothetical protein